MNIHISDKARALQALEDELQALEAQSKKTLRQIAALKAKYLAIGDCQMVVMDAMERLK